MPRPMRSVATSTQVFPERKLSTAACGGGEGQHEGRAGRVGSWGQSRAAHPACCCCVLLPPLVNSARPPTHHPPHTPPTHLPPPTYPPTTRSQTPPTHTPAAAWLWPAWIESTCTIHPPPTPDPAHTPAPTHQPTHHRPQTPPTPTCRAAWLWSAWIESTCTPSYISSLCSSLARSFVPTNTSTGGRSPPRDRLPQRQQLAGLPPHKEQALLHRRGRRIALAHGDAEWVPQHRSGEGLHLVCVWGGWGDSGRGQGEPLSKEQARVSTCVGGWEGGGGGAGFGAAAR